MYGCLSLVLLPTSYLPILSCSVRRCRRAWAATAAAAGCIPSATCQSS